MRFVGSILTRIFFIEITKVIPNELLVFANLPSSINGEYSTGVAVITLSENGGLTTVRLDDEPAIQLG